MRVRFETSLARSKDYVPLRKQSHMKVESEKDYETYLENNMEFSTRPGSYMSYSTYIASPASFHHSLASCAHSSVGWDPAGLSRPGSFKEFPSVSRPPSYVYPGHNPPRFDPEPTHVDFTKPARSSKVSTNSSNDTSSSG